MSKINDLKATLAELSVELGQDIEPAETAKELEQQISDAQALLNNTEEPEDAASSNGDFVKVKALKTVWTSHGGKNYRLNGDKTDKWPTALAEQERDAGNVEIMS